MGKNNRAALPFSTDEELIRLAVAGDHHAYGCIVDRYKGAGFRVALAILRNPSDAEDALQEAFTKAYVYLGRYSSNFRFYTWFSTIVRNVSLSHLRARDWMVSPLTDELLLPVRALVQDSPELAVVASSRADVVRDAVNVLPERYRQVLVLRYWHDLTYDEIAKATQQSLGAVKTQIRRAKLILAESLHVSDPRLATD